MKRATAIVAALFCLGWGNAAFSQTSAQVEWIGDVPVMPGLTIESGLGFAFSSPEGRIVTIYLAGSADAGEINRYYAQALDPLGWKPGSGGGWQREGEILTVQQVAAAGTRLWKIAIRPR